jgi:phosphotransferase system HPr (HPr) family protein
MERIVIIKNEQGIHARPAYELVRIASQFNSNINLECKGSLIDTKSYMNILSASLEKDDAVKIIADGSDEEEAVEALEKFLSSNFTE